MEDEPLLGGDQKKSLRFRGIKPKPKFLSSCHIDEAGNLGNEIADDTVDYMERHFEKLRREFVLAAVFVVSFHTKHGNIIEWQTPSDINLKGIEFKALVSGAHNVQKDFSYFRLNNYYGLSCYEKKILTLEEDVENKERGSRIKSVGIISLSYNNLAPHFYFLKKQVSLLLDTPGCYDNLINYYNEHKALIGDGRYHMVIRDAKNLHPIFTFKDNFLFYYSTNLFILWKLIMSGARIIIYSPPPLGPKCFHVHCLTYLCAHSRQKQLPCQPTIHPFFYINVADIDNLNTKHYIACTTEKIFKTKTNLYDAFIEDNIVTITTTAYQSLSQSNDSDVEKYNKLMNYFNEKRERKEEERGEEEEEGDFNEDRIFINFFQDLNNQLIDILLEVSMETENKQLCSPYLEKLPVSWPRDKHFLVLISELFAIDINMPNENPCCPT